ncbi:deoxyribose-phosphate aldolase [Thermophagus xiamenensis]|uniref:Deoxyribose-phosphate aldolase n=1 Tax=Thermophagus xiamenensis TaxID=385682 RepID=A0A1I2CZA4_9BACT|nr:deoxyribose-phosphate aldolase [Thermophagus xiamenensis]SFE73608.1 deoxyribose-phosphate aldolase [Thermophagus xiamenensis]
MELLLEKFKDQFHQLPEYNGNFEITEYRSPEVLKKIFSCIDLTSLNSTDSTASIEDFCNRLNAFHHKNPEMPLVSAICVYPVFAGVLKSRLNKLDVKRAVVAGGFPSSQTFLDLKVQEIKKALELGANEVDIVLSVGEFLEGNYSFVAEEIKTIKSVLEGHHLKVILETGALKNNQNIWDAAILSMASGADFIKTSTGKLSPAATPEAVWVMSHAIKIWHKETGKKVGLKAAGGISTTEDSLLYYSIVKNVLGDDWLCPELFRIGASRLANNLLSDLAVLEGKDFHQPF